MRTNILSVCPGSLLLLPLPAAIGLWATGHGYVAGWLPPLAIWLWYVPRAESSRRAAQAASLLLLVFGIQETFRGGETLAVSDTVGEGSVYVAARIVAASGMSDGRQRILLDPLIAPLQFPDCVQGTIGAGHGVELGATAWFRVQPRLADATCPFASLEIEPATEPTRTKAEAFAPEADASRLLLRTLTRGEKPAGWEAREAFAPLQAAGLGHLLAISGLHLTLIAALAFRTSRAMLAIVPWRVLRRPGVARNLYRLPWLVVLPACAVFVIYVGAPPSAVRAFSLVTAYAGFRLVARRHLAYDQMLLLALTACVVALPVQAATFSFALSMTAMCWFAPLAVLPVRWRLLAGAMLPWLGTLPLTATFGAGNPAAPLANLAGIPLFSTWVFPWAWITELANIAKWPWLSGLAFDAYRYGVWLLWRWAEFCNGRSSEAMDLQKLADWPRELYLCWALLPIWTTLFAQRWRWNRGKGE